MHLSHSGYALRFNDYSHRHGRELMMMTHQAELDDIVSVLSSLPGFPHGRTKNKTPKEYIAREFVKRGWESEAEISLGTGKTDYCDLMKNGVAIEQEYSRFETFFRDFFRFLLLYDKRRIDIGVIITYDEQAFSRWGTGVNPYQSARACLRRLVDFLNGEYATVIRFPLWCIGIE